MISSSFDLLPLVTETSELPSFTWRLICNNRQHTWAWKQAAKWWWWVWALCAMQACGMKNEERRETRQDKTRRAIRVGVINCVFHHYCNSAQWQINCTWNMPLPQTHPLLRLFKSVLWIVLIKSYLKPTLH
jgi:hypothetical protein